MTELGSIVTEQTEDSESGSCGKATKNCEMKIVDVETGKVLGPYQNGELWVKSPWVMTGYYKDPEATKNTIDEDGEFLDDGRGSMIFRLIQKHFSPRMGTLRGHSVFQRERRHIYR